VDIVLVAHISYPQLDENDIASMSAPIISGLLREELGFSGVVMSDDFRMGGLTGRYDVGEAAVRFINAGGDLILCGAVAESQIAIMQALQAAAADGSLSEARINESLMRILLLKLKSGLWTPS
jgi:beta-N-acetylhexosaminidase